MKKINVLLWVIQALLAALFLFAGVMKLAMPIAVLTKQSPLPGAFLRFIGVAEILGGLGLVLPGVTRIHRELTPLAAGGLVIIMIGATALTAAVFPAIVGVLAVFVAYGRTQLVVAAPRLAVSHG